MTARNGSAELHGSVPYLTHIFSLRIKEDLA